MTAVRLTNEKLTELKEAFMFYDYDKDGRIFSRDVAAVIRSVGLKPSQSEVRGIIDEIERNPDGDVDLQTLVALISQRVTMPPSERPEDLRDMFRLYDSDGRGFISVNEMKHLLTTVGEKLTDEEAEDLIRMSGCAERGAINYDKFIRLVLSG